MTCCLYIVVMSLFRYAFSLQYGRDKDVKFSTVAKTIANMETCKNFAERTYKDVRSTSGISLLPPQASRPSLIDPPAPSDAPDNHTQKLSPRFLPWQVIERYPSNISVLRAFGHFLTDVRFPCLVAKRCSCSNS